MADLLRTPDDLEALLRHRIRRKNAVIKALGVTAVSPKKTVEAVLAAQKRLRPMIMDTRPVLWEAVERGARILCEGAQGALLDIDHGTYPYVTSSSATAGGAAIGSGLPPALLTRVVGIFKAYCTRVGNGPFPSEDEGRGGDRLRNIGHEYGTTTGRPRRCGWFDAVAARTAVKVNGITDIALTKLDVLDGFRKLKVCTSYRIGTRTLEYFPADGLELERVRPRFETVDGWNESTRGCTLATLPARALDYVRYLERLVGCRITLVSLGPERKAMIKLPRGRGRS
jgi:adenylosuccinate synthase